jgi:hypothetical protein
MPDQVEVKVNLVADGYEKLDQIAASLGAIEHALVKATPAVDEHEEHLRHLKEEAEKTSEGIKKFGESIRQHIETPLGSASLSLGKAAEAMGPYGIAIGEAAATLTLIGTVAYEAMEKLGALGTEVTNVSIKTGLSTKEVGEFGFAAKAAGSDIHSFETAMRILSRSLSDNSDEGKKAKKAFNDYGIELKGLDGTLRPTGALFQEIGEKMAGMRTMADRNTFAMNTMGRAGLELVPTLMSLAETLAIAKEHGFGISAEDIATFHEYHLQLLTLQGDWDKFVREFEKPLAKVISIVYESVDHTTRLDRHQEPGLGAMAWQAGKSAMFGAFGSPGLLMQHAMGMDDYNRVGDISGDVTNKLSGGMANDGPKGNASRFLAGIAADQKRVDATLAGAEERYKTAEAAEKSAQNRYLESKGGYGIDKDGKAVDQPHLRQQWIDATAEAAKYKAVVDAIKASDEALKKSASERVAANRALDLLINAPDMQMLTGGDKYEAEQGKMIAKERAQGGDPTRVTAALLVSAKHAQTERVKDAKKQTDEIRKMQEDSKRESFSEQSRHDLKMAELSTPDQDKPQLERDARLRDAQDQKLSSIGAADRNFSVGDGQATTKQQHDEAEQTRNKAYYAAAIAFEKERLKIVNEYSEKTAETGKKESEALAKHNTELRKMSLDAESDRDVRDITHAQKVADLNVPLGSGEAGQRQAIAGGLQSSFAIAARNRTNAQDTANLNFADSTDSPEKKRQDLEKANAAATIKYEKEIYAAREEAGMKLLELAQKQAEQARSLSDTFFDAIVSKDSSKGIRDFFMGQAKDVGRSVFSNLTAPIFGGMQSAKDKLSSIGAKTPEIASRDKNTAALDRLTDKLDGGGKTGNTPSNSLAAPISSVLNKITGGNASTSVSAGNSVVQMLRNFYNIPSPGGSSGGGGGFGGGGGNTYGDGSSRNLWDFSQDDAGFDLGGGGGDFGGGGGGSGDFSGVGYSGGGSVGGSGSNGGGLSPQASVQAAVQSNASALSAKMSSVSAILTKAGAAIGGGAATVASGTALFGDPAMNKANGTSALGGGAIGQDIADGNYAGAIGAGIGLAGATYAGVKTALHDFSKGGAYGVIGGIGAVASTAANFDPEPISHAILESVASVSQLVTAIMGDPRQARQNQENKELTNDAYNSTGYIDQHGNYVPGAQAKSISYFGASNGQSFDTNFQGGIRGGSFASTTRNVYDPSAAANQVRNGSIAPPPGYSFDQATGYGDRAPGATGPLPSVSARSTPPMVIQVQTMDAKSFLDHAANISDAVRKGIQMGHPVIGEIQQVARTA